MFLEWRALVIVFSFCLICLGVAFEAYFLRLDQTSGEIYQQTRDLRKLRMSELEGVDYYVVSPGSSSVYLNAQRILNDSVVKRISFFDPKGEVVGKDSKKTYYSGKQGQFFQSENRIEIVGEAHVRQDSSELTADKIKYVMTDMRADAEGAVLLKTINKKNRDKMQIRSLKATAFFKDELYIFDDNVEGHLTRHNVYEGQVNFSGRRLRADLKKSWCHLSGDVEVNKNKLKANARHGEIFLENFNKKLKYYTLYDDVRLEEVYQTAKGLKKRLAYGERLDVFQGERRIVLSGAPRVFQDDDVIKGNKVTMWESKELIEVDDSKSSFHLKK